MRKFLGWWALALATASAVVACGGGSGSGQGGGGSGGTGGGGPSCGEKPRDCPSGETCWFAPSGDFECEPSGTGKEGDACAPTKGTPTCGDGLLCIQEPGKTGACATLCESAVGVNQCGNLLCVAVQAPSGAITHVCR